MRKTITVIGALLLLSALLCGCGSLRMNDHDGIPESPVLPTDLLPEMSPLISPDIEDGTTGDTDGIIERTDNPGTEPSASPSPSAEPKR